MGRSAALAAETERAVRERRAQDGLKASVSLSSKAQRRLEAKLHILAAVERLAREEKLGILEAQRVFAARYNAASRAYHEAKGLPWKDRRRKIT